MPISSDPMELFSLFFFLFSLFFDDEVVSHIVTETYTQQCLANTSTMWNTTSSEIRAYTGFQILMGINQLPEMRDYQKMRSYFTTPLHLRSLEAGLRRLAAISISLTTASYLRGQNRGIAGYRKLNPSSLQ